MKFLAIAASVFVSCSLASASNPRGDDLIVGDVECRIHTFELSPELEARAIEAREKVKREGRFGLTRTNPDGIIVTLKVEDDILWVTGIGISGGDGGYAVKPTVIPTEIITEPIKADWFSGELKAYYGRLLIFHIREFGFILNITNGKVASQKHVSFKTD